jgi:2-polyprenyl-3-methyl-5-hydroxy-6-metoxy-1,4-benzoquinol methylase
MTNISRVGVDVASKDRWAAVSEKYARAKDTGYHRHRLAVLRALLPNPLGSEDVDFGCGEGAIIRMLKGMGVSVVVGIDQNELLLNAARDQGSADGLHLGGVEQLQQMKQADCLVAANVLGYLTDAEEREFYEQAARILAPNRHVVISHSNLRSTNIRSRFARRISEPTFGHYFPGRTNRREAASTSEKIRSPTLTSLRSVVLRLSGRNT